MHAGSDLDVQKLPTAATTMIGTTKTMACSPSYPHSHELAWNDCCSRGSNRCLKDSSCCPCCCSVAPPFPTIAVVGSVDVDADADFDADFDVVACVSVSDADQEFPGRRWILQKDQNLMPMVKSLIPDVAVAVDSNTIGP